MKKETKKSFAAQGDCFAPFTLDPSCSFYLRRASVNAIPDLRSLSLRTARQNQHYYKPSYF